MGHTKCMSLSRLRLRPLPPPPLPYVPDFSHASPLCGHKGSYHCDHTVAYVSWSRDMSWGIDKKFRVLYMYMYRLTQSLYEINLWEWSYLVIAKQAQPPSMRMPCGNKMYCSSKSWENFTCFFYWVSWLPVLPALSLCHVMILIFCFLSVPYSHCPCIINCNRQHIYSSYFNRYSDPCECTSSLSHPRCPHILLSSSDIWCWVPPALMLSPSFSLRPVNLWVSYLVICIEYCLPELFRSPAVRLTEVPTSSGALYLWPSRILLSIGFLRCRQLWTVAVWHIGIWNLWVAVCSIYVSLTYHLFPSSSTRLLKYCTSLSSVCTTLFFPRCWRIPTGSTSLLNSMASCWLPSFAGRKYRLDMLKVGNPWYVAAVHFSSDPYLNSLSAISLISGIVAMALSKLSHPIPVMVSGHCLAESNGLVSRYPGIAYTGNVSIMSLLFRLMVLT